MRSGYSEDLDQWDLIRWRGAVASAIRGRRGQAFLKEMLASLDAMPEKRLIAEELEKDGEVCAIGCVGRARGIDMSELDVFDPDTIANTFGIATALVQEIEYVNDEDWRAANPEKRFEVVRKWVIENLRISDTAPIPAG